MKTTIDIPDEILKEAMGYCSATTKREAVLHALEEYNRRQRMARLARRLGTFEKFMTRKDLDRLRAE
jgi:Arc/MetJ family transcription regulator